MKAWRPVLYPFLIGIYPIVRLYSQNAVEVPPRLLVAPIAIVLAVSVLLWGLLRLTFKDAHRAGLVAAIGLVFFASVTAATPTVENYLTAATNLWVYHQVRVHRALVIVPYAGLVAALAYLVSRRLKEPRRLTPALNVFAAVLVALPAISSIRARAPEVDRRERSFPTLAKLEPTGHRPDIYYILLDGFARGDILKEAFDCDIEPTLRHLESRGFYVARRAIANYCQTPLSLGSSLNGDYHEDGAARGDADAIEVIPKLFSDNAVVRSLRPLGYRFVTFASGFDFTDGAVSDLYLSPYPYVSGFHRLLLQESPLASLLPNPMERDSYTMTRERTEFLLNALPEIAKQDGPTFTFAHVLSPHPPFVFGEDGEDVSPHGVPYYLNDGDVYKKYYGGDASYVSGYRKQAAYIAKRVARAIDAILNNSPEPPIILLQSDHGSGLHLDTGDAEATDLRERMSILSAYYLPGGDRAGLHPGISPVNSFRVVFNNGFAANLPLLPDESYFSPWVAPYRFIRVTDRVTGERATTAQADPALPHAK